MLWGPGHKPWRMRSPKPRRTVPGASVSRPFLMACALQATDKERKLAEVRV